MTDSRRDFIKKASLLAGGAGIWQSLPLSIQKALAINPDAGSNFYDAEHIVLLMQENRSFDHCFGALQGVRGFNDPRAITLPDKNLVWLQSNKAGETYAPFRLDIKNTKATWLGSLPHSWKSQVDARNNGKHDQWLEAKRSGNKECAEMPFTLGHYTREDLPFYYALADAFTVCDQHFCSSLTGTTPNRLYFWTGTIREQQKEDSPANVDNSDVDYGSPASWKTFPERLEENGISWKIYQNELSVGVGFSDEEDSWLANFTDNPLEWFVQYQVRFLPAHINYLTKRVAELPGEIDAMEQQLKTMPATDRKADALKKRIEKTKAWLDDSKKVLNDYTPDAFARLSTREKNLHQNAFTTNTGDPNYHQLTALQYEDNGEERQVQIPKGDVLHQFRKDVKNGQLPAVSWIVAADNFSDHPNAPWYGAWYVSEVLDILTRNPEVWKKTIFILTYDENDGYFDHVPPFVAPDPHRPATGKTSEGINTGVDYVTPEQERALRGQPKDPERVSPVGLGYRVPFIVASPWSRGGWVNSQVFDHTSVLQFLEKFFNKKTGAQIKETNISAWRRTVCGDLSSIFRPYRGEKITLPDFVKKDPFIESVYNARFKQLPSGYKVLTKEEIEDINRDPAGSSLMSLQESGIRSSCALPYQLYVEGALNADRSKFEINFTAENEIFGAQSAGAPFNVYAPGRFAAADNDHNDVKVYEPVRAWNYAVAAGDRLADRWDLRDFEDDRYHLRVYGPNGFFREFMGNAADPIIGIQLEYDRDRVNRKKLTGNLELQIRNMDDEKEYTLLITDHAYKAPPVSRTLPSKGREAIVLHLQRSLGWYDFTVSIKGNADFAKRYAGRVETGEPGFSDPAMGRIT